MPSISRRLAVVVLAFCPVASGAAPLEATDMFMEVPADAVDPRDVMAAALAGDPAPARALLARRPRDPAAWEFLGIALARSGDLPGARAALEGALKLSPEQYTAISKLGDLSLAEGDFAAARAYFERALGVAPQDRLPHQRLGYLDAMEGRRESAIRHYEAGLRGASPEYLGIKRDLAVLYNQRGDHDRALALLAPFADSSPPAPGVAVIMAEALTAAGEPDEAAALLRRAASSDFAAAIALAKRRASGGDLAAAEATLAEALSAMPERTELAFELGALRGLRRDYQGAAAAFSHGLRSAPNNPALLRGAMRAQERLGNVDAALALGERLGAGAQPGDVFLLADLRIRAGRLDAAEADYRRLLAMDARNVPALNNLAMLLLGRGEADEAVDLARRAVEAAPRLATAHDTLGRALSRQGDAAGAAAAFARAEELK